MLEIILIVAVVIVVLFLLYRIATFFLNCFLEAGDAQAFAIERGADIVEIVRKPKFHLSLVRRVVRGADRAREFQIPYYDTELNRIVPLSLLDRYTGAISLRDASVCLREIPEETQDHHAIKIDAELRFNLDKDRLTHCFRSRRFGDGLTRYFEFMVRSEVAGKTKNYVESNIEVIRRQILEEMQKYGSTRGFFANNVLLHIVGVRRGSQPGATDIDGISTAQSFEVISEDFLALFDKFRDLFRPEEPNIDRELLMNANNALLEILRIRGQETVARELAKSKTGLIVVTAQELGLVKSAISRNHMNIEPPSTPEASPAMGETDDVRQD